MSFGDAPIALRRAVTGRERIVIRRARGTDIADVGRLAGLADRPEPSVPLLLAESDGALVAAISIRTGELVSDPFVASDDVVALLRLRADQLDAAA